MTKLIGIKDVLALQPGQIIWDSKVSGFGARRQKGTAVAYVLFYRTKDGRQRWHTIGRHGSPWTPDMARKEARKVLGAVVSGSDPAHEKAKERHAATVAELCERYITDVKSGRLLTKKGEPKKLSTLMTDKSRTKCHIIPLLGKLTVSAVTRNDVDNFLHDVAGGKTAIWEKRKHGLGVAQVGRGSANRTLALLSSIFSYAVRARMRPDNPVHGVTKFANKQRDRRLSDSEYAMLGAGLAKAEAEKQIWPPAISAARFLALTGWRRGEALGLTWAEIDFERKTTTLGDTKTGRSMRPLSSAACDLLRAQSQVRALVFPATRGDKPMCGFPKFWAAIVTLGGLPADITPHTLRHSFASVANDLGYSESTIGALIGHKGHSITSRYIHSADAVLLAAADKVAEKIEGMMGCGIT